jgi:hypothetical protein
VGTKMKGRYKKPNRGMLHVRLVPKLSIAFRTWWMQERDRWDYLGERIGIEGLVAAWVHDFMSWPNEDRIAYMDRTIPPAEKAELAWIADLKRKIEAGEVEPDFPYTPIRPAQPPPAPVSHGKDVGGGGKAGKRHG